MKLDIANVEKVLKYAREQYGTEPEYLWAKAPTSFILRHHNSSKKWYAVVLVVSKQKLGISGSGNVYILDLKCDTMLIEHIVDGKSFFPGYHMNKKHWITIPLNGLVKDEDIFALIDVSYDLTN